MHIGIAVTYRLHGGGANHVRNLLSAWKRSSVSEEHRVTVFATQGTFAELDDVLDPQVERVTLHDQPGGLRGRLVWEQFRFAQLLGETDLDVLFAPGNFMPLRSPVPTVVLFQLIAPFCPSVRLATGVKDWLSFSFVGLLMRLSAARAERVIFLSNHFEQVFNERQRLPSGRGLVIPYGRDSIGNSPADQPWGERHRPYLLCLAHIFPYKNLLELIEGYAQVEQDLIGYDLVIAGAPSHRRYHASLLAKISELGLTDRVDYVGLIPFDEVPAAMRGCHAFIMQSTCESISVTLVDALEMGLPIACADAAALPEIGQDGVLYYRPDDPVSIGKAMLRISKDDGLRRALSDRAREAAAALPTWDEVGQQTLDALVKVGRNGSPQ